MRKMKKLCYTLGIILSKVNHISHIYLPICFFYAMVNSVYPLTIIYFPSRIIDLMINGAGFKQLALHVALCVTLPALLSILKALAKQKSDTLSVQIENDLQLSVNMALAKADYYKLEDPQVYLQLQKLRDGQNMAGKITNVIQYNLGTMLQCILGFLIYISLVIRLVQSDQAGSANNIVILLLIMAVFIFYIVIKGYFQQKQYLLVESFSGVERAYVYYVTLRSDYECGADIRLNRLSDMLRVYTEKHNLSERKMHFSINHFNGISDMVLVILTRVQYVIIYAYIIFKIIGGTVTIGEFYLYTNALVQALECLRGIVSQFTDLKLALDYYNAYILLWNMKEQDQECVKPEADQKVPGKIVFENVSFRYSTHDRWILENVNLTINAGEHIALVGKNGVGKSTLIKLLTGLYPLEKGHIYLEGTDIQSLSREELFSRFGAVFQDSRLLAATIAENIGVDFSDHVELNRIQKLLNTLGLTERLRGAGVNLPVTRHLSENGAMLSGGEEQKLLIGRALYKNASIIIMDEPMASLDPIAEKEINELVNKLLKGITTIIISHRLSTCVMCDRIAVLADGRFIEYGTHAELLAHEGTYSEMWKAQAKYYQDFLNENDV